jgi:hypothetical protein
MPQMVSWLVMARTMVEAMFSVKTTIFRQDRRFFGLNRRS